MDVLTKEVIASFKDAPRKLTGPKRRAFEAQVTLDYPDGNIGKAERVFGWSHHTVALGLNERRTGITGIDNFSARGNRQTEAKVPELEADLENTLRLSDHPPLLIDQLEGSGTEHRGDLLGFAGACGWEGERASDSVQ